MLIGYARVSTTDQSHALQTDALQHAGVERVFTDTISGAKTDRPGLREALEYVRSGDTLVVWRLDRLGRSIRHLIDTVNELQSRGVEFRSLSESIDTTTPGGKLIFHIFGALAEFERDLIRERTNAGLESARARGRVGGRKRVLNERQIPVAQSLMARDDLTVNTIAQTLGVSRSTLYRISKKAGNPS